MDSMSEACEINIIHFNDIYNVESQDNEYGAARFVHALNSRRDSNPLTFFSGDAFNPALMSTVTKGSQMVSVLNACNVNCAVYGNHDFDFGVDTLLKHVEGSTFPWLLSNVYDNISGALLAKGESYHIVEHQGKKIGLIGLVEKDWLETLSTVDSDDVTFVDFVEKGRELGDKLKAMGADMVIALTHMRWPNDEILAREVPQIDLILGGHDHDYGVKKINNRYVVKSGTDFRQFSEIKLTFLADGSAVQVDIKRVDLPPELPEDPEVKAAVDKYLEMMGDGKKLDKILGNMEVEMDGRFESVRTKETNLGNFITNIILSAVPADVALLNSGSLRSDIIHPKGPFHLRDLKRISPFVTPIVVIEATGKDLLAVLENGVSKYPAYEGRFLQVAGISFGFNPHKPAGQRIDHHFVKVQGQPLNLCKIYRVATTDYVADGNDGFTAFKTCPVLIDEETGPRLTTIVQNHFTSVKIVRGLKACHSNHHQSLFSVLERQRRRKQLQEQPASEPTLTQSDEPSTVQEESKVTPSTVQEESKVTPSSLQEESKVTPSSVQEESKVTPSSVQEQSKVTPSSVQEESKFNVTNAASKWKAYKRHHSIKTLERNLAGDEALSPKIEGRIYLLNDQNERVL